LRFVFSQRVIPGLASHNPWALADIFFFVFPFLFIIPLSEKTLTWRSVVPFHHTVNNQVFLIHIHITPSVSP